MKAMLSSIKLPVVLCAAGLLLQAISVFTVRPSTFLLFTGVGIPLMFLGSVLGARLVWLHLKGRGAL